MARYPKPVNPKANPQLEPCTAKLPKRLSPSAAKDFKQCPRMFWEKKVAKSVVWTDTEATTKGTLVHHALEKIFDHPRAERTADVAVGYIRPEWEKLSSKKSYAVLAAMPAAGLEKMLAEAEEMTREYFAIEDPTRFDPVWREEWIRAKLGSAQLNGIIDRFDSWQAADGTKRHAISDYKTGKMPGERYADEAFFAMKLYAAGIRESKGITVDQVRLIHTRFGKKGVMRLAIDDEVIDEAIVEFDGIWSDINDAADAGLFPCQTSVLCNWCDAQTTTCPAWQDKDGQPVDLNSRL